VHHAENVGDFAEGLTTQDKVNKFLTIGEFCDSRIRLYSLTMPLVWSRREVKHQSPVCVLWRTDHKNVSNVSGRHAQFFTDYCDS